MIFLSRRFYERVVCIFEKREERKIEETSAEFLGTSSHFLLSIFVLGRRGWLLSRLIGADGIRYGGVILAVLVLGRINDIFSQLLSPERVKKLVNVQETLATVPQTGGRGRSR